MRNQSDARLDVALKRAKTGTKGETATTGVFQKEEKSLGASRVHQVQLFRSSSTSREVLAMLR